MPDQKPKYYVGDGDFEPGEQGRLQKEAEAAEYRKLAQDKQEELLDETAKRFAMPEMELENFLRANYKDEESKEYLVNGAILTCTNCTKEDITYKGQTYKCPVEQDASIEREVDTSKYADKILKRLDVTENPLAEVNGLKFATIKDVKKKTNIPFFGNCDRVPDNVRENQLFNGLSGDEYKDGTCKLLMNLEEEWDNYEIGQEFLKFPDDDNQDKTGITMTSILFCKHGGFVYPVTSGQTSQGNMQLIYVAEEGAETSGKSSDIGGPPAGLPVSYHDSTYESRWKDNGTKSRFGERTPNYYILHHENSYIDENGLIRIRKIQGMETEDDYYCVAMARGFATAADALCTPAPQYNENFGFKLQVQLEDSMGNEKRIDVIIADVKASDDPNDFYTHASIVEFIVEDVPGDAISEGGNVSFDKLLGGQGLEIERVYAYDNGAMVVGNGYKGVHWEDR